MPLSVRRPSATARTVALALGLLSTGALLAVVDPPGPISGVPRVHFLVLTALFLAGGLLVFHVEFRDEAHSFTLTEVPLVVGLFLAEPMTLLVARLCGELLSLVAVPRQPVVKLLLNASVWVSEVAIALAVVTLLVPPDPGRPLSWLAVLVGVAVASAVSNAVVSRVIRWHGVDADLRQVLVTAVATSAVNSCLGLVAVLLLQVHVAGAAVLAVMAGVVFVGYRAHTRLAQRHASLRLLHDFSVAIGGTHRPDQVIEAMLHHARRLLRADVADLVVLQDDLRMTLRGNEPPRLHAVVDDDLRVLRALVEDGVSVLRARGDRSAADGVLDRLDCRDGLLVPVHLADGTDLVLTVGARVSDVSTFDDEDRRLFETLARHAGMALEKGRLIDELRAEASRRQHQALHDHLTGLPNRLRFHEHADAVIAAAGERGRRLAAVLMDLDGFKEVNDTLGHHTGDELLQEIGRRLGRAVRADDVAARLGGDEFALLLDLGPALDSSADDAREAVLRLLDEVEATVHLHGIDLDVRASVGVALCPDHGDSASDLLQRADVAMYQAKGAKQRVALYDPEVDTHAPWRLQLATDLRRGIEDGQLRVHYQPKADLATGRITGVEALVRWEHPEHGRISPEEFIPVAEQTGLITTLTYAVLETSLADAAGWARSGLGLGVAVNVSARSLLEPEFPARVVGLVARSGLRPEQLTLELTESSIMGDTRRATDVLQRLADEGIRLSVDDFGTGYSSLAYLQRLPVKELKVDRSFVFDIATNASDRAIVQSVLDLGHSLGLSVVAEGIENQLGWDALLEMGVDVGQGYFLSAPLPARDLHEWLVQRARRLAQAV